MCHDSAAASKEAAGAPANDIEVTPEMISAGRDVISKVWLDFIGPEGEALWGQVLEEVFLAMMKVHHKYAYLRALAFHKNAIIFS